MGSWLKRSDDRAHPTPAGDEERLVADLRRARLNAFCIGPLLIVAALILALVLLGARGVQSWTSTGTVLTVVVCVCWTGAGIALLLWACLWTPEAWARLVIQKSERNHRKDKRNRPGADGSASRKPGK